MDDLDLYKKAWQKDNQSFLQVSEKEIYTMIHKKSSSVVKWILVISLLELVFWNVINFLFFGENYFKKTYSVDFLEYIENFNHYFNLINYTVIVVFIMLFYKNYRTISSSSSAQKLMKDILKTRKTVIYYVWFNIMIFILATFALIY